MMRGKSASEYVKTKQNMNDQGLGHKQGIRSPFRSSKPVKTSDIRGTRNIV